MKVCIKLTIVYKDGGTYYWGELENIFSIVYFFSNNLIHTSIRKAIIQAQNKNLKRTKGKEKCNRTNGYV